MRSQTILHLEDDENDVLFLRMAFKAVPVHNPLQTVHDGQEAIDYLSGAGRFADRQRYPIPLLTLLDLKTPRKTGHDVLRWIRGQPELRQMVVIMLTASGNQSDVNAAYAAGANAFLVKPAGLDKLTEMVRALDTFWLRHNKFPADVNFSL